MNKPAATIDEADNQLTRLVIMLRYHDELTWPEIAAVLELSEADIRGRHDAVVAGMRRPRTCRPRRAK